MIRKQDKSKHSYVPKLTLMVLSVRPLSVPNTVAFIFVRLSTNGLMSKSSGLSEDAAVPRTRVSFGFEMFIADVCPRSLGSLKLGVGAVGKDALERLLAKDLNCLDKPVVPDVVESVLVVGNFVDDFLGLL